MPVAAPTSVADAIAAIAASPSSTILAGGTDLLVEVNNGRRRLESVVTLRLVSELRGWRIDGDDVVVGAATTYTDLLAPEFVEVMPALAAAARTVGSPQIRNAGTIGGNVATASPAGDTLPVLVALDAVVELAGPSGARSMPVGEFFVGPKRTARGDGELITAVRMHRWRGPQDYLKVGVRNAMVIAVASLAMAVDLDRRLVGVGLGSVGPTPLAAPDACAWLGDRLVWHEDHVALRDAADIASFGVRVAAAARPIDDHRSTAAYRAHAIGVLARRALRRATDGAARS